MPTSPSPSTPLLDVEYIDGIHIVDTVLWLDAPRRADLGFLSHAHLDRPVRHAKVLVSAATALLAQAQLANSKKLISPYHRRFSLGDLDLELHPAGHLLGAAQLRVTNAERTLVYTGHFDLETSRTCEPAEVLACDVLVLDAGHTAPGQQRPGRAGQEKALIGWVKQCLAQRAQPVVLAPALGEAQELASLFAEHDLQVRAHRSIYEACRIYHTQGVKLPGVKRFRGTPARDEVTLFPLVERRAKAIDRLPRARLALVGASAPRRQNTTRVFDFACGADHPAICRYARESRARRIYVVGRFAEALAADLRAQGLRAWPLQPPEQMNMFGPPNSTAAS